MLLVLSAALVLTYAVLNSQSTALQIQRNSGRTLEAKQVATSGMLAAIRRMHQTNWAGVETTFTGSYGTSGSYEVSFTTGDAQIVPGSAEDHHWPYRVTLLAKGSVTNPDHPTVKATYEIEAVVQLVPRGLSATPSEWSSITQHTLYQLSTDDCRLEVPISIKGPVRFQSGIQLITSNSIGDSSARTRYAGDLNLMRNAGYPDYRPFNNTVKFPYSMNDSSMRSFLQTQLGVSTSDVSLTSTSLPASFSAPTGYQLYAGGKVYSPQSLPSSVNGGTYEASPRTNPLGLFVRNGSVDLKNNTTIRGTLIATDQVNIDGTNVTLEAVNLESIEGASQPSRLPVIYARNLALNATSGATIRGATLVLQEFQSISGDQATMNVTFTGNVAARRIRLRGRNGWSNASWPLLMTLFNLQANLLNGIKYFPVYAHALGYQAVPVVTLQPETEQVTEHCPDVGQPIYVPRSSDPGLRWQLIRWTDGV
ncbi:MAG: hypothetical protein KF708_19480 [Pirellulales bacterium]|nr:hypothetical protein [Pirellulales bacterium]